jgi:hypothetical protein
MARDFPAPVEDRCLSLGLREVRWIAVYLLKAGNGILIGKWVHFVALDLRLKMEEK